MKASRSALFLFELVFVILVFTVSAAICAHIFGQAYNYSRDSRDLTDAMLIAESRAEEFKAGKDDFPLQGVTEVCFDKNWNELGALDKLNSDDSKTLNKKRVAHTMRVITTHNEYVKIIEMSFDDDLYKLAAMRSLLQ